MPFDAMASSKELLLLQVDCFHDDDSPETDAWVEYLSDASITCDMVVLCKESPSMISFPGEELRPCGASNLIVFERVSGINTYQLSISNCKMGSSEVVPSNDVTEWTQRSQATTIAMSMNVTSALNSFFEEKKTYENDAEDSEDPIQDFRDTTSVKDNGRYHNVLASFGLASSDFKSMPRHEVNHLHRMIENELFEINCILLFVAFIGVVLIGALCCAAWDLLLHRSKSQSKKRVPSSITPVVGKREVVSPISMEQPKPPITPFEKHVLQTLLSNRPFDPKNQVAAIKAPKSKWHGATQKKLVNGRYVMRPTPVTPEPSNDASSSDEGAEEDDAENERAPVNTDFDDADAVKAFVDDYWGEG